MDIRTAPSGDSKLALVRAAKPFVLVADGEPHQARVLVSRLAEWGCYASAALSGKDALRFIAENDPDAVVADWSLPDMEGPELARRVRADGYAAAVILLWADADWKQLRRALECGANDLLGRPFTLDRLLWSLSACCPRIGESAWKAARRRCSRG